MDVTGFDMGKTSFIMFYGKKCVIMFYGTSIGFALLLKFI